MTTSDPNTGTAPDDILAAALARYGTARPNGELTQITGDQYVEQVLTARLAAWVDDQRPAYKAKGLKPKNIWGRCWRASSATPTPRTSGRRSRSAARGRASTGPRRTGRRERCSPMAGCIESPSEWID